MAGNTGPESGFTLIELLVVLAILGLALSLLISHGGAGQATLTVRGAATGLAAGLREARSLAVAENRPVALSIDTGGRRWHIDGRPVTALPPEIGLHLKTVASETGDNRGDDNGGGVGRFRFFPDGSATGGRIELTGANRRFIVAVDWLTGRVSLADGP